jgi:hypothetical protein
MVMEIPAHLTLFVPELHSKKAMAASYYQRNRERSLIAVRKYQASHREETREYQRRYYQEHLKGRRQAARPTKTVITSPTITYKENYIVSFD